MSYFDDSTLNRNSSMGLCPILFGLFKMFLLVELTFLGEQNFNLGLYSINFWSQRSNSIIKRWFFEFLCSNKSPNKVKIDILQLNSTRSFDVLKRNTNVENVGTPIERSHRAEFKNIYFESPNKIGHNPMDEFRFKVESSK